MELFHRRYLCLFAFLFLFASVCAANIGVAVKIGVLIALFVLSIVGVLLLIFQRKHRFSAAVAFVSVLFVLGAMFNSLVFIDMPELNAEKYISDEATVARIKILQRTEEDVYKVRIENIGSEAVSIKATLLTYGMSELDYGERIISSFNTSKPYEDDKSDSALILTIANKAPILHKNAEVVSYFSFDGVMAICNGIQRGFKEYIDKIFGDASGIVKGFLIDDRSEIPSAVQADFRRSGTTHLLAVSGLHITLLLGGFELLLRRLWVPKVVRVLINSIAALMLLILTDFSGSAVRAVLMLYAVYLSYLFYEDHDTVTALFVSAFLIVLLSPFSVYDIGMWMSFFATLGLVTVYAYIDSRLPRIKSDGTLKSRVQGLLLTASRAVIISLVANFFLLPIMWIYFGEISLSAIPANLVMSPIVTLFLPVCAIGVLIGGIPYVNIAFMFAVKIFERVIYALADIFANMRGAVLSLKYPFAFWLIMIFAALLAALLVINLKHKLIVCLPAVAFAVTFCICLCIFNWNSKPILRQEERSCGTLLFYDDAARSSICDMTDGGEVARLTLFGARNPYATEIEHYVISRCNSGQPLMINGIIPKVYIRRIYIPLSDDAEEMESAAEIYSLAKEYGSQVIFYSDKTAIELFGELTMK